MSENFIWQCKCGYLEHNEMPEDCPKCLRVASFKQIPEDQIEDKVEEEILSLNPEDGEEDDED